MATRIGWRTRHRRFPGVRSAGLFLRLANGWVVSTCSQRNVPVLMRLRWMSHSLFLQNHVNAHHCGEDQLSQIVVRRNVFFDAKHVVVC